MIRHIVFWKLKDTAEGKTRQENAEHIKKSLESLKGIIPGMIDAEVGINENGGTFDAALNSCFESMDALKAYDIHPGHLKVREFITKVRLSREAVDYEI